MTATIPWPILVTFQWAVDILHCEAQTRRVFLRTYGPERGADEWAPQARLHRANVADARLRLAQIAKIGQRQGMSFLDIARAARERSRTTPQDR